MRKSLLAVLAAFLVMFGLTACGSDETQEVDTYRPASLGENGNCYYVEDDDECEHWDDHDSSFVPVLMPLLWHQTYAPYYHSDHYVNKHVDKDRRAKYRSNAKTFERTYASQIKSLAPKAVYKTSSGKTITGDKVKPGQFGGGNRVSVGGGRRTCAFGATYMDVFAKPGGGGGGFSGGGGSRSSGGGSIGGGSRSSSSSGGSKSSGSSGSKSSGTKSNTSTTRGC